MSVNICCENTRRMLTGETASRNINKKNYKICSRKAQLLLRWPRNVAYATSCFVNNTKITSYLASCPSYRAVLVKFSLSSDGGTCL